MCGIAFCVCLQEVSDTVLKSTEWLNILENNSKRGPDLEHTENLRLPAGPNSSVHLSFFASTLHLRGTKPFIQPHVSEDAIFCWNGEIFGGIDISLDQNDGAVLLAALENSRDSKEIYSLISRIEGPYGFVYYQRKSHQLYFARDPLGRRSLLIHYPTEEHPFLSLSSVSAGPGYGCVFVELNPNYIYSFDVSQLFAGSPFSESLLHREDRSLYPGKAVLSINDCIPENPSPPSTTELPEELSDAVDKLFHVLDRSIEEQVKSIPPPLVPDGCRVAVLFSGGIDSTVIAFLADRHVPFGEPIDLLNVAFENPRRMRPHTDHNKRKLKTSNKAYAILNDGIYNVPDRLSGLEELEELRHLCPNRRWNFVKIDVDYTQSSQAKDIVQRIMYPSKTVMDLSLGLALYFASKGTGVLKGFGQDISYSSPAKVLLNGLGSDELLGGYGRHRSAFKTGGWLALVKELQLELDRLPSRNLGRDDRIISHHGKETRHPFLSLSVVNSISQLPVHLKTDPRLDLGLGDKMLLRLLSKKLGLELASSRKKKAMQFGSYSARMEVGIGDGDGEKPLYEE